MKLNDEEKKAIEELKSCILFWKGQLISSDNEEDEKIAKKEININNTLLNLIEKQQKEIKELKAKHYFISGLRNGKSLLKQNVERAAEFERLKKRK